MRDHVLQLPLPLHPPAVSSSAKVKRVGFARFLKGTFPRRAGGAVWVAIKIKIVVPSGKFVWQFDLSCTVSQSRYVAHTQTRRDTQRHAETTTKFFQTRHNT